MTQRKEYRLTFRGETVDSFKSVHPYVHVVLTYKRESTRLGGIVPGGHIARRPSVVTWMKTAKAALKTIDDDSTHLATYPGQSFVVKATPGTTEITDVEALT